MSMQSSDSIPVSMLRQWCFCPRIVFYRHLMGLSAPDKPWMKTGTEQHERQMMLMEHRSFRRFQQRHGEWDFEVKLSSPVLGIHGKVDAVLKTDSEICPIEIKANLKHIPRGYKIQLCAYALLLEETTGKPIKQGYFLLGEKAKAHAIAIDSDLRKSTLKIIQDMNVMLIKAVKPDSSATEAQCEQCEFLNYCNDRF